MGQHIGGYNRGGFRNFTSGQRPTRSELNRFLGLPSDGGLHNLAGQTQSRGSRIYSNIRTGNHILTPHSPSRNYNNAVAIRRNYHNYNFYTPGWYRRYPRAWYPSVWAYGGPWLYVPWPSLSVWLGYPYQPMYYDYGTNVIYQNDYVIVNGQNVGTPAQYYGQAQTLAAAGAQPPPQDAQWMPLGVFALSQDDQTSSDMTIQLAIDKQGVIRGNYTNAISGDTKVVQGSVDKQNERAAWTIGDNTSTVFDCGIYNLTKDETPVLVHFGDNRTEQWQMVRLDKASQSAAE